MSYTHGLYCFWGGCFYPFILEAGSILLQNFWKKDLTVDPDGFYLFFSLLAYVLTKVSITIYAGGIVVSELLGISFWYGAIGVVIFTGIYTVIGGLKAVIYTETLQTVILIFGSLLITILGLNEVGGWGQLRETVTSVSPDHFDMWRPISDPNFPWTGMLIGGTIVGIWYWCTDQYIVQRTLAANNITIARRGAIFGAYLKLLPILIFLMPGIIAFALTLQQPETYIVDRADRAFPMLVKTLLPVGIKGLVAGGLMAALMSSLASVFNSCSTIFTIDIYKKIKPDMSEKSLIKIGKIATFVIVLLGIIWIPIMDKIGGGVMYQYLQNVQSYIAPPVTAVFLLGIIWRRVTSDGAIYTLLSGLILLILRLGSEIYFQEEILSGTGGHGIAFTFATINFAHMAIFMFIFSVFICICVSLMTVQPDYGKIEGLSFGTMTHQMKKEFQNSFNKTDLILSLVLVGLVISILFYFTG